MKFKGFDKRNVFEIEVLAIQEKDEEGCTWEQVKEIEDTPYHRELIETLLIRDYEGTDYAKAVEIKLKKAEVLELLGFNFFFKYEKPKEEEPYWKGWKCLDWNKDYIELSSWYIDHIYYYDENTYRYTVERD